MRRLVIVAALCAACEPDFWAFSSGSGGTKAVVVYVSDSPVDEAEELFVTVDSVELQGGGGTEILSSTPREIELLALRNGRRALLGSAQVREGIYDRIVLRVSAARLDGRVLDVLDRVVEIDGPFIVEDDTDFLVDFNARMSVLGGALRPVCNASDLATARFLDGHVVDDRGTPVAGAVVSAQRAGDEVSSGRTDAAGGFRLGPVPPGPFTLVATARGKGIATGTGPVLVLAPEDTGDLTGVAAGSYVRLMQGGSLIAVAGIEAGEFTFRQVPVGAYELEVWGGGGLLEIREIVR